MRVTQIESSTESVTSQYRRRNAPEPNGKRYHMKNCSGILVMALHIVALLSYAMVIRRYPLNFVETVEK